MAGGVRELTTEYCSYVWGQDQKQELTPLEVEVIIMMIGM